MRAMRGCFVVLVLLLFVPLIAGAQGDVQGLLINFLGFLNSAVVPFIFALAFLFFLYNALRYFIIGATDEEGRKKAKRLAIYGILAFVVMVSIWGIVNILVDGLGFGQSGAVCPDAIPDCNYMLESESGFYGDLDGGTGGTFVPNKPDILKGNTPSGFGTVGI